jgi:hypothetical protein
MCVCVSACVHKYMYRRNALLNLCIDKSSSLTVTITYPRSCSGICVDTTEVVEADHDEEVVPVEDIECEHDGVLCCVQVGNYVDVHGADHHRDANYHQHETQLQHVWWREGGRSG